MEAVLGLEIVRKRKLISGCRAPGQQKAANSVVFTPRTSLTTYEYYPQAAGKDPTVVLLRLPTPTVTGGGTTYLPGEMGMGKVMLLPHKLGVAPS